MLIPDRRLPFAAAFSSAAAFVLLAVSSAIAAEPKKPGLVIELNKVEQKDAACRLTLLIENRFEARIDALDFELALFGKDDRLVKLLAISAGAFPAAKTRVRQFDLADTQCASIGRFLLNTITTCSGTGVTPDTCLERTTTRSTAAIPLAY